MPKLILDKHKITSILLLLLAFNSVAYGSTCLELKNNFKNKIKVNESLTELQQMISAGDPCAKNTLGVLYAQGEIFSQDNDKSYAIFYDLSQKDYPPAQLNLAISLSKKSDVFDEVIPEYLLGLFAKYYGVMDWGTIATDSRNLGREYFTKSILSTANKGREQEIEKLQKLYEDAIKKITLDTASAVLKQEQETRDSVNALVGIVSLGVMAYSAGAALGRAASYSNNIASKIIPIPNPRLYLLTPTGNSNILYMMPLH